MKSKPVLSWGSIAGSTRSKCKGPEVKYMVVRKARRVIKLEKSE